jgi:enamine deaminase RidA (YjgF/YER057c/UK114 family)
VAPVLNAATSRVKTLIQLTSPEALHSLQPDLASVEELCTRLGSTGLYPFAVSNRDTASPAVSARQFPKSSGYPEDPATGIAATALAWGLRELKIVGDEEAMVTVHQGEAMRSPSCIFVRLPAASATEQVCWLRGDACDMDGADARLRALAAYESAARASPSGLYSSFSQAGDLLFSSGVVGRKNGQVITGQLIGPACVSRGEEAATAAVIAILRAAQDALGSLDRVVKVVTLTGYLNASNGFQNHVQVMDAASAAIARIFPDAPMPARTTVGVTSLPGGGAVEVSLSILVTTSPPA